LHAIGLRWQRIKQINFFFIFKGIKPCVGAFGANQFKPTQQRYIENFFSIFYVSINVGSLISTILTPIFRSEKCFGDDCFPLAFGVPAAFMFVAIVFFVIGTPFYDRSKDKVKNKSIWENIILQTVGCIFTALYRKIKRSGPPKEHWLDHSLGKYSAQTVSDVKAFCRVGFVFLPLPIYWTLYDQQGSRWTDQAQQLDGKVGSATILPDQFQAANAILIVLL
jgi:solute carrier family 15 oligopeptide transporter 1